MKIKSDTLRTLRNQKGLTMEMLADKSKVSARQIARIEKGEIDNVRPYTAERLAKALGVSPEELAKKVVASKDEALAQIGWRRIPVPASVVGRMNLVEHLYGISMRDQLELLPLLVALVGEWSLLWRKNKLDELENATRQVMDFAGDKSPLAFASLVYHVEDGIYGAKEALAKGPYAQDWADSIYDNTEWDVIFESRHPFTDFLLHLINKIGNENIEIIDDTYFPPAYELAEELVNTLAAGDNAVSMALAEGYIRPKDIPEKLMPGEDGDPYAEARIKFIKQKLPKAFWNAKQKRDEILSKISLDELFSENASPKPETEQAEQDNKEG